MSHINCFSEESILTNDFYLANLTDTDLLAEKALVKPRDVYEKIDYSSAYEPAPDISFDNEFSRLGLVTDVVKGLANQGERAFHKYIAACFNYSTLHSS